jgi:hypothetical protein
MNPESARNQLKIGGKSRGAGIARWTRDGGGACTTSLRRGAGCTAAGFGAGRFCPPFRGTGVAAAAG